VARIVTHHELVLLGHQPAHAGGAVLFKGVSARRILEAMLDCARAVAVFGSSGFHLTAVPEEDLVVGVEREEQILEVVVLEVPNRLLLLAGVGPDCHAEVLTLLSVAILLHV
jgi:hypothetical protein